MVLELGWGVPGGPCPGPPQAGRGLRGARRCQPRPRRERGPALRHGVGVGDGGTGGAGSRIKFIYSSAWLVLAAGGHRGGGGPWWGLQHPRSFGGGGASAAGATPEAPHWLFLERGGWVGQNFFGPPPPQHPESSALPAPHCGRVSQCPGPALPRRAPLVTPPAQGGGQPWHPPLPPPLGWGTVAGVGGRMGCVCFPFLCIFFQRLPGEAHPPPPTTGTGSTGRRRGPAAPARRALGQAEPPPPAGHRPG